MGERAGQSRAERGGRSPKRTELSAHELGAGSRVRRPEARAGGRGRARHTPPAALLPGPGPHGSLSRPLHLFPALTRSTSPMTDRSDGLLKSTRLLRAAHTKGKTCRLTGFKTAPGGQVLPGEWTLPPAPCSGQATMPPPHLTRPRHALAIAASGKLPSHHKCRVSVRPLRTAAAVTLTRTSSEVALCGCRLPRSKADK